MENISNRRILLAIGFVLFFAIVVMVWYFFYAKPIISPTLTETNNPFPTQKLPPRFQFINWGGEDASTTTTEVTNPLALPLVKVWGKPATGHTFVTQNILKESITTVIQGTTTSEVKKVIRATSTVLIFVDRTTGYVYGYSTEIGTIFQISNTILPGVSDAYFFDTGRRVIIRYIDQEKNKIVGVIATVPNVESGEVALPLENIQYLTSSVTSVAVNKKQNAVSYAVATDKGSAIYTITPRGPALVTSSPFKEWSLAYGGNSLYATSKPSTYVNGGTFSVPLFQPEVGDKTGLMSTPGNNGSILNSMWGAQGLVTFVTNNGTVNILSSRTLASKCAWGDSTFLACAIPRSLPRTTEGLPDDWFQGRVSFSDDFYIINLADGGKYELYYFKDTDGVFDVVNPIIAQGQTFLGFNRKQDGSLWLLNFNLLGGSDAE